MKIPYDDAYALDRKLKLEYGLIEAGIMTPNEYRRSIGLEPLRSESIHRIPYYSEKDIPKVLNCPNCGAPITGCKCEYCGTVFRHHLNDDIRGKLSDFNLRRTQADINAELIDIMKYYQTTYSPASHSTDVYYKDQKLCSIDDSELVDHTYSDFLNIIKEKIKKVLK